MLRTSLPCAAPADSHPRRTERPLPNRGRAAYPTTGLPYNASRDPRHRSPAPAHQGHAAYPAPPTLHQLPCTRPALYRALDIDHLARNRTAARALPYNDRPPATKAQASRPASPRRNLPTYPTPVPVRAAARRVAPSRVPAAPQRPTSSPD